MIISEKDRYELGLVENQSKDQSQIEKVDDALQMSYFLQLFCPPEDAKRGVYRGNLLKSKHFCYYLIFKRQHLDKR